MLIIIIWSIKRRVDKKSTTLILILLMFGCSVKIPPNFGNEKNKVENETENVHFRSQQNNLRVVEQLSGRQG